MSATVNALTIIWELGIGMSALLAGYFLTSKRTKDWSAKKIILVSSVASLAITVSAVYLFIYWR